MSMDPIARDPIARDPMDGAPDLTDEAFIAWLRTRFDQAAGSLKVARLEIVNEAGTEQAVIEVAQGRAELRLGGTRAAMPCEVVIFAGEDEPGMYAAGIDLRANGDSAGSGSVTVAGSQVDLQIYGLDGGAGNEGQ